MKRRNIVEYVVLVIFSIGAVVFVAYTVYADLKTTRQRALFYQLQILRMGVNIYQLVNHSNPGNLSDIVVKTYKLPGDLNAKRFIDVMSVDGKGRIFDPFGDPYFYDPMTGWVRSTTSGYEFW